MEKFIITIFGTSLISKLKSKLINADSNLIKLIDTKFSNSTLNNKNKILIKKYKNDFISFLKKNDIDVSAEINSLINLNKYYSEGCKYNIIALTTDTPLSRLSAEIANEFFKKYYSKSFTFKKIVTIKHLQVDNEKYFNIGLDNLVKEIRNIFSEFSVEYQDFINSENKLNFISKHFLFNISGGFKIIIPTITIISQIYSIRSFYIFEKSKSILFPPLIPLGFDSFMLEDIFYILESINRKSVNDDFYKKNKEILKKIKDYGFINEDYKLSQLGRLFIDYIMDRSYLSNSVLGFFVEYKIYEYFLESQKYSQIIHSYKDNGPELDFVLDNNIIVEVKPLFYGPINSLNKNSFNDSNKLIEQIQRQLNYYTNFKEYHLYLYSPIIMNNKNNYRIINNAKKILKYLKNKYKKIKFSGYLVNWKIKHLSPQDNKYKFFMRHKLNEKSITKFFS